MRIIRILVVDDDRDVLEMAECFFNEAGMDVHCVENGEAALQKVKETNFSAIITDYSMPGMNGLELAEKVKEINPLIPIILISGKFSDELSRLALQAGIFSALPKPFHPGKILTLLNEAIPPTSS